MPKKKQPKNRNAPRGTKATNYRLDAGTLAAIDRIAVYLGATTRAAAIRYAVTRTDEQIFPANAKRA